MSCDCWKSKYKSMSFVQLLSARVPGPHMMDQRDRLEHAEYILQELRIKAPREYVLAESPSNHVVDRDFAKERLVQPQRAGTWWTA